MPDPPDVSVLTRYVLENPWPVGIALLIGAAAAGWTGLREGLASRQRVAFGLALAGVAVLATGMLVTTSGERARQITRELVDAVVNKDVLAAEAMFASDAALALGSPRNPGWGIETINDLLRRSAERYTIESNSITMLRGYSESSTAGVAHMACATTVEGFPYPNVSQWVLRIEKQADGSWRIAHLTCISINDQPPPLDALR